MKITSELLGRKVMYNGKEETIIMIDKNESTPMQIAITDDSVNTGYTPHQSRYISTCEILDGVNTVHWGWIGTEYAIKNLL